MKFEELARVAMRKRRRQLEAKCSSARGRGWDKAVARQARRIQGGNDGIVGPAKRLQYRLELEEHDHDVR